MSNVNTANTIIATDKRRLDGDLRGIQQELDDLMNQIKNSEEKTKKALSDAGKNETSGATLAWVPQVPLQLSI